MKEKDEKKANAEAKKKKCARQTKKEEEGFFDPLFFLSFPNQNPQRERARWSCTLKHRFISLLSALLRFSFFSLGVFIRRTSRWSRARAYIYIYISRNARSRRVSLERRDEKKREKERKRTRETTIPEEKGKRKKERSNRFFGAKVV
jgi:hypothetical protein